MLENEGEIVEEQPEVIAQQDPEVGEMSAKVMWKFSRNETLGLVKGTPPLSSTKTLKF